MAHERWRHHLDYVIVLLGFAVGSGTFIKFPYLCMRNGGGAFLIPFVLFTIVGTIPCVFLEMVIGQYSQSGPVNVWNLCPPFKGIGVGTVIIMFLYTTSYSVIFAWFAYYFYNSFSSSLPWGHCGNTWNTETCISHTIDDNRTLTNVSDMLTNSTVGTYGTGPINVTSVAGMTATEEFWRLQVLQVTSGLETIGDLRWTMAACLLITYVILFLCVFKGIRVSGKLVYVTVAVPYVLMLVFLVRGCLLPGSADGIYYYIYPRFEKLLEPKIWIEACSFALYSLGIGFGCVITLSGHSRFSNNCFKDAIQVTLIDMISTIIFGFAFFAVIGHVAYKRGLSVEDFESSGFNLIFIVFPQILTYLPLPQVWAVFTFLMLMTLEIDSLVPAFEIVVAAVRDQFPVQAERRWLVTGAIAVGNFLFALLYITQGGIYVLTLVDWFTYFPSVAIFVILECLVVGWCYGARRLQEDINSMWGKSVPRVMIISIKYICPLLLLIIFCHSLYSYRPPKYGDYDYPPWATVVGWMVSLCSLVPLPIVFGVTVFRSSGNTLKMKLKHALVPDPSWIRRTSSDSTTDEVLQPMALEQERYLPSERTSSV
ncbi:sodium-dependent dopamine transporter-like [Haliotis rufescens]|uniref:sodium-dependent dopamine transporter-like n=1 Tax=Haliotis rufescens TaxID=6454 RepID=UPI00201F0666|nr:sodium-dependent dopamine transporter-like [Haliotis rufescens]